MKTIAILLGISSTTNSFGWGPTYAIKPLHKTIQKQEMNLSSEADSSEYSSSDITSKDINPCWQDIYDDDCGMSTIYSSTFIAQDWIKSMPCASGLEDCDMPEHLKVPGTYQDGVESIDVMKLLGLKRASDLSP